MTVRATNFPNVAFAKTPGKPNGGGLMPKGFPKFPQGSSARVMFSTRITATLITVLTAAVFCLPLSAQTPAKTPRVNEESEVIKVDSRLVVVPVSVTDQAGLPVKGLKVSDFRISEENRTQEIDSVLTAEDVPLEIALIFDISATTSPMFSFQQEAAMMFLRDVLRSRDRASIFTMGEVPLLVQGRETAEKSIEAVRKIRPTKQSTAVFDTISAASDYLRANAPEGTRRVVLVISDGEDTNNRSIAKAVQDGYKSVSEKLNTIDSKTLDQLTVARRDEARRAERARVMKFLQNTDIVFYSINPAGSSYKLNKASIAGQENLDKFADETGGSAFLPKFLPVDLKDQKQNTANMKNNVAVLSSIFLQLSSELRAQYLVQYYSASEHPDNKYVRLQVALRDRSGLRVRARQGYFVKN